MIRAWLVLGSVLLHPAPRPQGAPEDRAELVGQVESWYKVVQGDRNVGFIHESIERVWTAEGERRYLYARASDIILTEPEPNGTGRERDQAESLRAHGILDESWSPVWLGITLSIDGRTREFQLAGRSASKEPDSYALPPLLFYSLRQRDQLSRPGRRVANLIDPGADGRAPLPATFEVSALARKEFWGRLVPLTGIVFEKSPPASFPQTEIRSAQIDKYGRIVEATLRGGARWVLVPGEEEAFAGAVNMHRSDLGEPFDKARALRASLEKPDPAGPAVGAPRVTEDTLRSSLALAQELLAELRREKSRKTPEAQRSAYLSLLALWFRLRSVAARRDPELLGPIDRLRDEAEAVFEGSAATLAEARGVYREALRLAQEDRPAAARGRLSRLRGYLDRIELAGRPERETLLGWIGLAEGEARRARIREELAQKPIAVSAVTVAWIPEPRRVELGVRIFGHALGSDATVRFARDASMAVINGAVYRTGDRVESVDVEVLRITSHGIQVGWKGEVREIPLGTK
jgi:hypothetical protein